VASSTARLVPEAWQSRAVESKRLRQWLCAKHKVVSGSKRSLSKRFSEAPLRDVLGLVCPNKRARNLPWGDIVILSPRAGGKSAHPVR
jgi:hypothetical protein